MYSTISTQLNKVYCRMKYIEIINSIDFDVTMKDTEALAYLDFCLGIHFSSIIMAIRFIMKTKKKNRKF